MSNEAIPKLDRESFFRLTMKQMGAPYIWGSKGREVLIGTKKVITFDCSGLVTWAFWKLTEGKLDKRQVWNTDGMWDYLKPTSTPKPGDLVFYGMQGARPDPNHVMIWVGFADMVFGACGGGRATTTPKDSAKVQVRERVLYRPDLLGFRSLSRLTGEK